MLTRDTTLELCLYYGSWRVSLTPPLPHAIGSAIVVQRSSDAPTSSHMPKQSRALLTRERLITVGREAFGDRGHEGVSLERDILLPAKVSVGSFYHQFTDKTDLLLAIMSDAAERRRAAVVEGGFALDTGEPLNERLRRGVTNFYASLDRKDHAWRMQLHVQHSTEPRVRALVLAGREEWTRQLATFLSVQTEADPARLEFAARTMVAFGAGLAVTYFDIKPRDRPKRRPGLIDAATNLLDGGLPALVSS